MSNLSCCFKHPNGDTGRVSKMALRAKRENNQSFGKGLWIDQEVLARHLQSRITQSSRPEDKHTEFNNRILKLADLVLTEQRRFDRE